MKLESYEIDLITNVLNQYLVYVKNNFYKKSNEDFYNKIENLIDKLIDIQIENIKEIEKSYEKE